MRQTELHEILHNGTDTSKAAGESIQSSKNQWQREVFSFIQQRGEYGATADEIEAGIKMAGNTIRPRIVELRELELVIKTVRTRPTRSGRSAAVYVTKDFT